MNMGMIGAGAVLGQAGGYLGDLATAQRNACAAPVVQPRTLVRAIDSLDKLNGRLLELNAQCAGLAQSIGGPFPVAGDTSQQISKAPEGAIELLNERVDSAHRRVDELQQAIAAMQRALGS